MSKAMKQWQLSSFGLDQLLQTELAPPVAKRHEVLIRVLAVALNYRDLLVIDGLLLPEKPAMPFVPASDMMGEIVEIGADVQRFKVGDKVIGHFWTQWLDDQPPPEMLHHGVSLGGPLPGVLAEYLVLHEEVAVKAPQSLTDVQAACLPIAGLTAWFALMEMGQLHAEQTVLLQGTGGVALFGLQIAQAFGAKVIVTSSTAAKLDRVKALGAWATINTQQSPNWSATALQLTNGKGVDHVLELIGGDNFRESLLSLAQGGRISQIGFLQSSDIGFSAVPMMLKTATIQGITVGHRRALERLVQAIDQFNIIPIIDKVYGFDDVIAAFEHLRQGAFGKIVIKLSG